MPDGSETFIIPGATERTAILGRTGSGKTQFAVWLLSEQNFDTMPWVVFNFKNDALIDAIPGTIEWDIEKPPPKKPGIYIVRPTVGSKADTEILDEFLHKCWAKENVGLYIDEGYMATGLKWFRTCLTQGRSRHVPMIVLSQRPVFLDRFVWSEADYFAAFSLNLADDKITTQNFVPGYRHVKLPQYHALWHDVKEGRGVILAPVPERVMLLRKFRDRIKVQRRVL